MSGVESISLDTPRETRTFEHGQAQLVTVGGSTVGRFTFEPGWRWSSSVKPIVGTDRCENEHVGYAISGHMHVVDAAGVGSENRGGRGLQHRPGSRRLDRWDGDVRRPRVQERRTVRQAEVGPHTRVTPFG